MSRVLRTVLSALMILVGALSVVAWMLGSLIVNAVSDGDVVATMVAASLDTPPVERALTTQVQQGVTGQLERQGIDVEALGLDGVVASIVSNSVESEQLRASVAEQVTAAREQIERELTREDRTEGPLVLAFDVSGVVSQRLQETPVLGSLVPDIAVPPVVVEVVDGPTFDTARSTYGWAQWSAQWGLWLGAALVVAGLIVSPRRRWFFAKFFLAVAVMSAAVWVAVWWLDPEDVEAVAPGQVPDSFADALGEALTGQTADLVAERALWVTAASLALAVVLAAVAAATKPGESARHHT